MVENNIIDKTVGNGLEAYKGGSRSCYEQVGDLDLLLLVPNFNFRLSFYNREELYKHEIEIKSLESCDTVYNQICNMLELDPKRVSSSNGNGMIKYVIKWLSVQIYLRIM